jgi:hypothetical protein
LHGLQEIRDKEVETAALEQQNRRRGDECFVRKNSPQHTGIDSNVFIGDDVLVNKFPWGSNGSRSKQERRQ